MKKYYTLGFLFNESLNHVVLLEKQRPDWQRGKLNGIGGHIEENETPFICMKREFSEEVDYPYEDKINWIGFATMKGNDFEVFCFAGTCKMLQSILPRTDEPIRFLETDLIVPSRTDMIENLPWLIAMAIDVLTDGRPAYAYIEYPDRI